MRRYAIETFTPQLKPFTIHLVFLADNYSERWLRSSDGKPNVAYVQLEATTANALQREGTLRQTLFADYRREVEQTLYQKLVEIGKADEGARQRVRQRADEICAALCAIVVEERDGQVHCLNKDESQPVAIYDQSTATICVEDWKWSVKSTNQHKQEKTEGNHTSAGASERFSVADWWAKNQFIVWSSIIMLIVVPLFMILGMLRIKEMAEQSNVAPTDSLIVLPDTIISQPDTLISQPPTPNSQPNHE